MEDGEAAEAPAAVEVESSSSRQTMPKVREGAGDAVTTCVVGEEGAGASENAGSVDPKPEPMVGEGAWSEAEAAAWPTARAAPKLAGGPRTDRGLPPDGVIEGPPVADGEVMVAGTYWYGNTLSSK